MDKTVSAIPVADYSQKEMDAAVKTHFGLLGADKLIKPGMRVALKPNLLMKAEAEKAITTHPTLVAAVIRQLLSMGIGPEDIVLADSPGGPYTAGALDGIYRASGLTRVAEETGVTLNRDIGYAALRCDEAVLCREFNIITPVAGADVVINLPKLKTHGMVMLSAGVKNLFGCVPGLQKPQLHFRFREKADFCRMLVDLALLAKPVLTIVDAVESMEGNGPSGGTIRRTGMTFAARNVYALDLAMCEYTGLPPELVLTVKHAVDAGLCPDRPEGLKWLGAKPDRLTDFAAPDSRPLNFTSHVPGFLKKPAGYVLERFFDAKPQIIKEKCIGCGKCAESCAPGAAVVRDRKADIDYGKCIKCYCCHEMCPVKAVRIKRSLFSRRISI